jgi:ribosome modulation factor
MYKLYKFEMDYGRHGSLEGLFISSEEYLNLLNDATIYFGEVLGKHSEVWIEEFKWQECCTVVSDDQDKIQWLIEILGYDLSGFNPENYYEYYESDEYKEGFESTPEDDCPYELEGERARWFKGLHDRLIDDADSGENNEENNED